MKFLYRSLLAIAFMATLFSCKNDTKEEKLDKPRKTVVKKEKKVLTQEEKDLVNSVMTKSMTTTELKTFASALVSAGIVDTLSRQKGPFTVFAPSTEAFDKLSVEERKLLTSPNKKEELIQVLRSHIVRGEMDSATLVQNIKKNGSQKMETLSGETLTATMSGSDIVIKNSEGDKGMVGKSDIKGSNGVVHVIDAVLVKDPK